MMWTRDGVEITDNFNQRFRLVRKGIKGALNPNFLNLTINKEKNLL